MKRRRETIQLHLNYRVERTESKQGVFRGGVVDPEFLGELAVWVYEQEVYSPELDDFVRNGKKSVNVGGSARALFELGRYLIALSRFDPGEDPHYHDHFEDLRQLEGQEPVELTIHAPEDMSPGTEP